MRSLALVVIVSAALGHRSRAMAELSVAAVFGDNLVLQQGRPVPVWGRAAPGEEISVAFGGQEAKAKAGRDGKWCGMLAAMKANAQPQEMTIAGGADKLVLKNVLLGEVWLCSGQSNMVWPVVHSLNAPQECKAAKFPAIRAFTAYGAAPAYTNPTRVREFSLTPQKTCRGAWQICTPKTVLRWSGVGYFFARELHRRLEVPVGIVVSGFGATAIEAWISVPGLKAVPSYRDRAERFEEAARAYQKDREGYEAAKARMQLRYLDRRQAWFRKLDAEAPGLQQRWMDPSLDTSGWDTVSLPVTVNDNPIGTPVASIWFRKVVSIPEAWVGKELELRLGVIDGVDESYVNGVRVGRVWFDTPRYWVASRVYTVPPAATTTTRVTVALRLLKLVYQMALFGPADKMQLVLKGAPEAQPVSLAGEWRLRKAKDLDPSEQPHPPFRDVPGSHYGHPGVMYNALIHPLIPYAIRGAIWYQGEANAPFHVDYRELLPGLITAWRREWGQGDFPFGIVQLANYGGQQTRPVERWGYVNIRDAQAAALRVPNTFLATAVDIGEGGNIHPRNKQEVGRRLALGALATAYGQKLVHSGPVYRSMTIEGSSIRLQFDSTGGLRSKGDPIVGFVVAGQDRAFYFAKARIEGESVVVWSEKVPAPVAVRYAWACNPVCNLYNGADLPVFPFRTDDWDPAKVVIPDDQIVLPTGWRRR